MVEIDKTTFNPNQYKKRHKNGQELPMRIMRFLVDNIELANIGQGRVGFKCSRFWDMKKDEFESIFGVEIKEDTNN